MRTRRLNEGKVATQLKKVNVRSVDDFDDAITIGSKAIRFTEALVDADSDIVPKEAKSDLNKALDYLYDGHRKIVDYRDNIRYIANALR